MDNINSLIGLFKDVNPSYKRLYSNKTQRKALERMVKEHGEVKVENMIKYLPKTIGEKFAPIITTPLTLESKLGNLVAYIQRQKNSQPKTLII